jgi:hypothetical protein
LLIDASRYAQRTGIAFIVEFFLSGRKRFVAGMIK